jgi:uroporphyrinogen III methyltransferase / synthase
VVADTREAGPDRRLALLLEGAGARVLSTPCMRILGPGDEGPLRGAVLRLTSFDWLVLASGNAARAVLSAAAAVGVAPGAGAPRVCVVGPGTREVLEEGGWRVDLVADRHLAEGILEALGAAGGVEGERVLLPRAADAPDLLPEGLAGLGAEVVVVEAYRNVPDGEGMERLRRGVVAGQVDVVALTAASVARRVAEVLEGTGGGVRVAAIGPSTAAAARECGMEVHAVADPHTLEGLVAACGEALRGDA